MADDNKPLKYMRYAIGEIVLVVIGILIALQINTWNEQRKNKIKIISFFKEVQSDLLKDISNIEETRSLYKMKDSLAYLVLNNELTRDDYKKSDHWEELFLLIANYNIFQFDTNGYNNLKLNVNDIPLSNKAIYDSLTTLYEQYKKILEDQNIRIGNYVYENRKYLSNNKEWYSDFSSWKSNDTIIDYFLLDPFYKNRVREFQVLIEDSYKKYKIDAIIIYEQLGVITKSNKPLPKHLKNYIADSESLKQYIGVYKPIDSVQDTTPMIVNEKGFFYGNEKETLVQEGNDKFGFEYGYNGSLTFQRDQMGELIGVDYNNYDYKAEYKKID